MLAQRLGHGPAEAADDVVLLDHQHRLGLGRRGGQRLRVDRLHGRDRQEIHGDPILRQPLGRFHGHDHRDSARDDGQILPVAELPGLSDRKRLGPLEQDRRLVPAAPDERRAVPAQRQLERLLHLHRIGGDDHHHVGQGAHHADVQDGLMAGPVIGVRQAAVGPRQHHRQVVVANRVPDLVGALQHQEQGERVDHRAQPRGGHPRGDVRHVGLGHADVEEPLRKGLGEAAGLGAGRHVGVQHNQLGNLRTQLHQRLAQGITHRDELDFGFHRAASNSARVLRSSGRPFA